MRVHIIVAAVIGLLAMGASAEEPYQVAWSRQLGSSGIDFARAQQLFEEDFETGLDGWIGKEGGPHSGILVVDPLRPSNTVLTFTETTTYGDIFGEFITPPSGVLTLAFDYLGLEQEGSIPGDLGGFIGYYVSPLEGRMACRDARGVRHIG